MRNLIPVAVLASAFIACSQPALARGGGGPGGGGSSHAGGSLSSSKAAANSNGRFAVDRDKGLGRAAERKSARSKGQPKATDVVKKKGEPTVHSANAATPAIPATPPAPPVPGKASAATPALPATPAIPPFK